MCRKLRQDLWDQFHKSSPIRGTSLVAIVRNFDLAAVKDTFLRVHDHNWKDPTETPGCCEAFDELDRAAGPQWPYGPKVVVSVNSDIDMDLLYLILCLRGTGEKPIATAIKCAVASEYLRRQDADEHWLRENDERVSQVTNG